MRHRKDMKADRHCRSSTSLADAFDLFIDLRILRTFLADCVVALHCRPLSYGAVDATSRRSAGWIAGCSHRCRTCWRPAGAGVQGLAAAALGRRRAVAALATRALGSPAAAAGDRLRRGAVRGKLCRLAPRLAWRAPQEIQWYFETSGGLQLSGRRRQDLRRLPSLLYDALQRGGGRAFVIWDYA